MMRRGPGERRTHAVGDWLFGSCLVVCLGGLAVAAYGQWRQGVALCAVGLLVTSWTRLVLPDAMAGMLRVRRKAVDVLGLTLLGAALLVLAIIVPSGTGLPATP
jgi:Protein of unknown function (DUF3017)